MTIRHRRRSRQRSRRRRRSLRQTRRRRRQRPVRRQSRRRRELAAEVEAEPVRKQPEQWEGIHLRQYKRVSHRRAAVRLQQQFHMRQRPERQLGRSRQDRSVGTQWCAQRSAGGEVQAQAKQADRVPAGPTSHRSVGRQAAQSVEQRAEAPFQPICHPQQL